MNKQIEKIKKIREFLLKQVAGLTTDQLNIIPRGYDNNIAWNLAHLVSAQQMICYARAGVPFTIAETYIFPYLPGTRPEQLITGTEIDAIKERMITTIDQLQADYEQTIFTNYTFSERIYQVYGMEVNNIDNALDFILYHEGFHTGCVLMLKHLV